MQIEFIGCTGAGKSTLIKNMVKTCQEKGLSVPVGEEYILRLLHLNWIKNYPVRTFFIDIFSLMVCILTLVKNFGFYKLIIKIIRRLPASVNWFDKFNITRNAFKRIGIYETICKYNTNQKLVFIDEGTVHAAHILFVHAFAKAPLEYFSDFIQTVPLPDVVIYLQQDETVLVERTFARGHKRIRWDSINLVREFIRQATDIFSKIEQIPELKEKLIIIDSDGEVRTKSTYNGNPSVNLVLNLIRNTFTNINKIKY